MHLRWQQLFADLEAQALALEAADLAAEVSERTRGEIAQISLVNRLRAAIGHRVELRVLGAKPVTGILIRVGSDWALVATPDETIVVLDAVLAAVELGVAAVSDSGVDPVASRVGQGPVWRAIARDRAPVTIQLRDGSTVTGTPDRVGSDFVDVARHELDQAPRSSGVFGRWTITWSAVGVVTRHDAGGRRD